MDSSIVIPALATILGGLIVYFGNKAVNSANANAVDVKTFRELVQDVQGLNDKVINLESKNIALWHYVYSLLEHIRREGGMPPLPPVELETDEKLMKIINGVRKTVGVENDKTL